MPIQRKTQETINQFTTGYGPILLNSRSKENVNHVNCNDHNMYIYFFNLQRSCRGNAMCDVYSSFRTDFIDTNGFKKNATFDYYFLSVREVVNV